MPFIAYDLYRLSFYVLHIVLGSYAVFGRKRTIDSYVVIYGLLYLIGTFIDTYKLSSNLELTTIQELIISGVYFHFMHRKLKWTKLMIGVWCLQLLLLIASFSTTLDFGVFNEAVIYMSDYGYLDTNEAHKIRMIYSLILQVLFLITVYKVIRDEEWSTDIRVFLIYTFIFFIGQMDVFIFNMITPLMYENIDLFFKVRMRIMPIIFGVINTGLLLNLIWKRSN